VKREREEREKEGKNIMREKEERVLEREAEERKKEEIERERKRYGDGERREKGIKKKGRVQARERE